MASKCRTALVEPPIAPKTRIAFSNALRVRMRRQAHVIARHAHDQPSAFVRNAPALRVNGGCRGIVGEGDAHRLHHACHGGGAAHGHAGAAVYATCRIQPP